VRENRRGEHNNKSKARKPVQGQSTGSLAAGFACAFFSVL